MTSTATHQNLDRQLQLKADEYGISVNKLKTVYFRGVDEYHSSDFDMGTPTMWGLARVQRFINSVATGTPLLSDDDLLAVEGEKAIATAHGISIVASDVILDVLYADGTRTAEMFKPGEVQAISLEDDIITVAGVLDGEDWHYTLDTVSGGHKLIFE